MKPPDLFLVDLVARDMEATIAFYRALGVEIPEAAIWRTATGIHHVDINMRARPAFAVCRRAFNST